MSDFATLAAKAAEEKTEPLATAAATADDDDDEAVPEVYPFPYIYY